MKSSLQQQLIADFLIESFEGLDQFDQDLLGLEQGSADGETLNRIFRAIHSIKGTAGCLGIQRMEKVAHVGENLLSLMREGRLKANKDIISTLLKYADALREMLRNLEQSGTEGTTDHSALIARLQELQGEPSVASTPSPAPSSAPAPAPAAAAIATPETVAPEAVTPPVSTEPNPPPTSAAPTAEEDAAWGFFSDAPAAPAPSAAAAVESAPISATPPTSSAPTVERETTSRGSIADSAIRVDVGHLDKLMNLVGELVLARNQIVQHIRSSRDSAMLPVAQRLNLITTELQEGVMKTRMQPIDNVWAKFPRIVRDVSQELGKVVRLEMEGRNTELDRTIIEAIKDPLTHILRNSIDHGIESPAKRRAAGKSEAGLLYLRAFHEGGQVNIEIMDDGAGVNTARVKEKALQKGLVPPEQIARMSDREACNLIFLPGLSTAEKISNVSGRGVGMDVVKTNIEKIGGSVDVQSEAGQGTTIKIKIPLTLAIIPALTVRSGGERFAIPQVNLLELLRVESGSAENSIENIFDAPVYRLRGKLLPLVFLNRVLSLEPPDPSTLTSLNIVVLQADGRLFGLVVDSVSDTEEIVVKPLGKQLSGLTCFAGATIMGDGQVALILDVMGLAQHAQVAAVERTAVSAKTEEAQTDEQTRRQTLLLFSVGDRPRMAMTLSEAGRLEEIPRAKVERAGRREVVQYRGQILPLIRVAQHLPGGGEDPIADPMHVVVYSEQGRSVGLVVSNIEDIVEDAVRVEHRISRDGIVGSAVVHGRVTDLLDVKGIIREAEPAFFES
ncbi:MAG: chemotaxis protein CheW [Verrucomicrobiales bacterium]|nr:chemotaxis protein CheW [Verrucomicrobiales bacterium]